MRKLKIVMAATGISSKACDTYLNEVSKRLKKRGHKVWLVCVNPEKVKGHEIPVYWSGPKYKWLWPLYFLCPYFQDRTISRLVTKGINQVKEVDIVNLEIPSLMYCYKRRKGEKVVIRGWFYPHSLWKRIRIMWPVGPVNIIQRIIFMLRQVWFYLGDKYGFKRADAIITLVPKLASQLKKRGFKTIWIPLGTEMKPPPARGSASLSCLTRLTRPASSPQGGEIRRHEIKEYRKQQIEKPVKLGTVVYDLENPRKGIKYLLKAIRTLEGMNLPNDSYRVELVGGYTGKLEEEIKKLGLEEKIKLLGKLSHPQVIARLQKWSLFVFPSLFEEFSLASVEALGAGLAVVGWKIDALKATCGNTGILLPKGNVKLLAKTLARLINDPDLRKKAGYQSWQRAKKYFDWDTVVSRLEKVYLHPTG